MENMLNQAPNSNYMDHLYCHPNEVNKNYIRNNHNSKTTNNVGGGNGSGNNENAVCETITINTDDSSEDMLQGEVNSLKSMLLFHFDLIQTQAEQLQAKDIELKTQKAECEKLRVRNTQLTGQVADIQQQLEEQMKRNMVVKRSSLPPPPLAKIQCLNDNVNNKGFITTTSTTTTTTPIPTIANTTLADLTRMPKLATAVNIKKVINSESTIVKNNQTITPTTTTTTKSTLTPPLLVVKEDKSQSINTKLKLNNVQVENESTKVEKTVNSIKIDEEKRKIATNMENSNELAEISTKKKSVEEHDRNNRTTKSNKSIDNEVKDEIPMQNMKRSNSILSIKANTASSETTNCFSSIHSSTSCSSPSSSTTLLGAKSKRRRVWQVPDLVSDEESVNSYDSMLDIETRSTNQITPPRTESGAEDTGSGSCDSSLDCCEREDCSGCSESGSSLTSATVASDQTLKEPKYFYYTANSPYMSRPWQEEELDGELEDDIAEALRAAEPNLEIPKWTEHDIVPLYNIEGTEDLSDEIFAKRHAKLELDEKRRKKWDVQQIREQRRLEKLRKRHCKDELNQGPVIQSFFPLNEDLERICFVDTLPVQAFGEPIPLLPHNGEGFLLPWLLETDGRPLPPPKKATEFYRFGLKKMTRREEKLWEEYLDEVEDASQDMENNELKLKEDNVEIKPENLANNDESVKIKNEAGKKEEEEAEQNNSVIDASLVKEESNATTTSTSNSKCDNNEHVTEERKLRIADCCYAAPTIMLAKNCRPCASRTQQRRRLRYSSYIYLTKRRRQLSISATNKTIVNNNNNNSNVLTTATISTTATATKTTSSSNISNLSSPTTSSITITSTKTYCKNAIKKNSLPLNNKMSILKTNTTTTTTNKNLTNARKSKGQQQLTATSTTSSTNTNNHSTNKNTHNNSSTTTRTANSLDKTKENITTTSNSTVNTNANENSNKIVEIGATSATATTTTTTNTINNSIKSKLRNLRSSSSPCSYRSSSNSNSSINLDNITTTTSTLSSIPTTTTISTPTLIAITKTK